MPAVVDPGRVRRGHRGGRHLAEPAARPLVQRPVADHDLGHPGRDGQRGLLHDRAGRAAAVADLAEERQLAGAQLAGDRDLGAAVHHERDQAVHVGGGQAGVVQRGADRLGGQLQLAAARVLGELGRAQAGDGRGPAGHAALSWQAEPHRAGHVIAGAAPAGHGDRPLAVRGRPGPAGERQRVPGVAGRAEPDGDRPDHRAGPGPAGHEPLDQPGAGQDVHEDVPAAPGDGQVAVVMDVLEVAGGQRRRDHERRRGLDRPAPAGFAELAGSLRAAGRRCLPSSLLRRSFVAPASLVGKTAPRPCHAPCRLRRRGARPAGSARRRCARTPPARASRSAPGPGRCPACRPAPARPRAAPPAR